VRPGEDVAGGESGPGALYPTGCRLKAEQMDCQGLVSGHSGGERGDGPGWCGEAGWIASGTSSGGHRSAAAGRVAGRRWVSRCRRGGARAEAVAGGEWPVGRARRVAVGRGEKAASRLGRVAGGRGRVGP